MDEVLADTLAKQLAWLRGEYGHTLTPEMLAGRRLEDAVPPEHCQALEARIHRSGFFADLPLITASQQVVQELSAHNEIFVATAAMEYPGSFAAKFDWLARYFPFIPASHIVFCGDKSILAADFLIDDNAHHLRSFRGHGVLFTAPHNMYVTDYPRVNGWEGVRHMFLSDTHSVSRHDRQGSDVLNRCVRQIGSFDLNGASITA